MNGSSLLNPITMSVKTPLYSNIFTQHFLLSTSHNCVYVTALGLKLSHNATISFVSYAYLLVMAN